MFCPAGTSLESRDLGYLWGRGTGTHVWSLSQISLFCNSMVLTIPDLFIALSSLYPAPGLSNLSCYHGARVMFSP